MSILESSFETAIDWRPDRREQHNIVWTLLQHISCSSGESRHLSRQLFGHELQHIITTTPISANLTLHGLPLRAHTTELWRGIVVVWGEIGTTPR